MLSEKYIEFSKETAKELEADLEQAYLRFKLMNGDREIVFLVREFEYILDPEFLFCRSDSISNFVYHFLLLHLIWFDFRNNKEKRNDLPKNKSKKN